MTGMTPTDGIMETGRNVRAYTKANMETFWQVLKPIAPWLIVLTLFDTAVNYMQPAFDGKFSLGQLIANYFFACLAISWHRVVLQGPEQATPVNPLRPQKDDWKFIGMGILLFVGMAMVMSIFGITAAFLPVPIAIVLMVAAILVLSVCYVKVMFYFPARAVGRTLPLDEAFSLSKGYVLRIIFTPFIAAWRVMLAALGYFVIFTVALAFISGALSGDPDQVNIVVLAIGGILISMPLLVYFIPMIMVLSVGVLSNYYRHAIENKSA